MSIDLSTLKKLSRNLLTIQSVPFLTSKVVLERVRFLNNVISLPVKKRLFNVDFGKGNIIHNEFNIDFDIRQVRN